jgi:hypothetical protein
LVGKKGAARRDRGEVLPVETVRIQGAPFLTPASAQREAAEPNICSAGDGEGIDAAIVGATTSSSSSFSSLSEMFTFCSSII